MIIADVPMANCLVSLLRFCSNSSIIDSRVKQASVTSPTAIHRKDIDNAVNTRDDHPSRMRRTRARHRLPHGGHSHDNVWSEWRTFTGVMTARPTGGPPVTSAACRRRRHFNATTQTWKERTRDGIMQTAVQAPPPPPPARPPAGARACV